MDSRPSDSLTQRLDTPQDTSVVTETAEVGGVLPNDPVEELLEGLSGKLPEEDQGVCGSKAALEPVKHGRLFGVVEPGLEDTSPDPRSSEHSDDRDLITGVSAVDFPGPNCTHEGDFGSSLDLDVLSVKEGTIGAWSESA